jgi:hypothetical protein
LPTFSCRPDSKVLKTKAVNYDVMRTWLDTLGGATSVEAAVAQAACVQTLLNQVVGLEALESQVARASSMRTELEKLGDMTSVDAAEAKAASV